MPEEREPLKTQSLTPNAIQLDWENPVEFPCCPQQVTDNPLETYMANLVEGMVFCRIRGTGLIFLEPKFSHWDRYLGMTVAVIKACGLRSISDFQLLTLERRKSVIQEVMRSLDVRPRQLSRVTGMNYETIRNIAKKLP